MRLRSLLLVATACQGYPSQMGGRRPHPQGAQKVAGALPTSRDERRCRPLRARCALVSGACRLGLRRSRRRGSAVPTPGEEPEARQFPRVDSGEAEIRQERCLRVLGEFDRVLWQRHGRQASALPLLDHRKSAWHGTTRGLGAEPLPPGSRLLGRSPRSHQSQSFFEAVEGAFALGLLEG